MVSDPDFDRPKLSAGTQRRTAQQCYTARQKSLQLSHYIVIVVAASQVMMSILNTLKKARYRGQDLLWGG